MRRADCARARQRVGPAGGTGRKACTRCSDGDDGGRELGARHDVGLCAATAEPDLYAPVAARLGVDRPAAKVAVLVARYGQTSGAAGKALAGLDAAYPVAMRYLRTAEQAGRWRAPGIARFVADVAIVQRGSEAKP